MKTRINWGIIGTGKMASKFASDIRLSKNAILFGVASRDVGKAKKFGDKYNASRYYGSYEELAADPGIDVVYIATPHVFHFENTMMCLRNGRHVLCEKPLGINADEVRSMIEESRSGKLFLMEGIWTRFIPAIEKLIELLKEGVIGEIIYLKADFGFKAGYDPEGRIYNKTLGGGSLLDIGIYPIYLSLLALGKPEDIQVTARMTPTGVDASCTLLFGYENAAKAVLESTFEFETPTEAYIYGTEGAIKLHSRFHHPERLTLYREGNPVKNFKIQYQGNGYFHEIEEVNNCLLNGKNESPKLPLSTSLELIKVMDRVRKKIGLRYGEETR